MLRHIATQSNAVNLYCKQSTILNNQPKQDLVTQSNI